MKKVKMTNTKLRDLKAKKEKAWKVYKALKEKLDDLCHCPKAFMVTETGYQTDTLGNNGTNTYYDVCSVCGKHHDSYGGVYSDHKIGPNYKEKSEEETDEDLF